MWGKRTSWADRKEALASIRRIAEDVVDRMLAEFNAEDRCLACIAFDLDTWGAALGQSCASTPGEATNAARKLEKAARRLCTCFGVPHDAAAWRGLAQSALVERARLRHCEAGNRRAWRAVLDAGGHPMSHGVAGALLLGHVGWDGSG